MMAAISNALSVVLVRLGWSMINSLLVPFGTIIGCKYLRADRLRLCDNANFTL